METDTIASLTLPFLTEISLEMLQFYWFLQTQIQGRLSRCHQHTGQQLELYTPENSLDMYTMSVKKEIKKTYNDIL